MCAWSGGTFSRTNGVNSGTDVWQQDKLEPVNILASRQDYHDQDLADGINACVKKDGANATNVVATAWIQDSAVTTAKIADANITEAKLADDAASRSTLLGDFGQASYGEGSFGASVMTRYDKPNTAIIAPKACKVTHLSILTGAALNSGSITFTIYKNEVAQASTLTISSASTRASSGQFNGALSSTISFAAGDRISVYAAFSSVDWNPGTTASLLVDVWGHFTE